MTYEEAVHVAFLDELQKIAAAGGLTKAALSLAPVAGMAKKLVGGGAPAAAKVVNPFKPAGMLQRAGTDLKQSFGQLRKGNVKDLGGWAHPTPTPMFGTDAAKAKMLAHSQKHAPSIRGPGMFQRFGQSLSEGGQQLQGTRLTGVGQVAQAGPLRRMAGEVAGTTGQHYAHNSGLRSALNPLGTAIGGVTQGVTHGLGREMQAAGTALAGRSQGAVGQKAGKIIAGTGKGMQAASKPIGMAGEIGGLVAGGGAIHAPLSAAGLLGHNIAGYAGHAVPMIGDALHGAGESVSHLAHDVLGGGAMSTASRAKNFVAKRMPSFSGFGRAVGPAMTHGAVP